ncbi:AlbA family DNA-binding domain-containing protein [Delftia tsuruhatensis]|uniref:AlbA family DNA-binding domain-containing protein n=1 Tax=Delftia tsuruhatensis TaxID=180282 RepID=UPI0028A5AB73|nr:ATP-binding protein [Delftia tsuruhatensis]
MNEQLLNRLRYKSEGTDIDFKSKQYAFAGANEFEKSEILKDVLAMANAWREGPAYILLGFLDQRPHPAEVVGISSNIDDSTLQEFVNSKVKPKLTFRYEEHLYGGKTVGVITIPKQKRPFFVSKTYGKLKPNIVYVRRGSSTDEADPTEVGDMVLADSGRGSVQLDLLVLATDNEPLPKTFALRYLHYSEKLPDYASARESDGPFGMSIRSSIWHDNKDFWREYARYAVVDAALIEMKFVLLNRSETQLSNAKLEVSVEPLDGQGFQMFPGMDMPEMPNSQWSPLMRGLPDLLERRDARLVVDEGGVTPLCHIRFGSLLPSEEGRSTDSLAIVPSGPGKFRLKFRILAAELSAPQEVEQIIEATGETVVLDVDALEDLYSKAVYAKYKADEEESD